MSLGSPEAARTPEACALSFTGTTAATTAPLLAIAAGGVVWLDKKDGSEPVH
jgi:hypothetical protein